MDNPLRLRRASRRLRFVFTVILVLIPVLHIAAWLFVNELPVSAQQNMLPQFAVLPLPLKARLMGLAASLLPAGFAMYGMVVLIRLMKLYEVGEIFRAANVRCFRGLSRAMMGWSAASLLSQPIMSLGLTLHRPPGQRLLVLGLSSAEVTILLVGLVLAVLAWVMDEGRKLQDEQDYTV